MTTFAQAADAVRNMHRTYEALSKVVEVLDNAAKLAGAEGEALARVDKLRDEGVSLAADLARAKADLTLARDKARKAIVDAESIAAGAIDAANDRASAIVAVAEQKLRDANAQAEGIVSAAREVAEQYTESVKHARAELDEIEKKEAKARAYLAKLQG